MNAAFTGLSRSRGPRSVGLLQDFLNTADIESGSDLVATPSALTGWLASKGLVAGDGKVSAAEHARVLELRELLRDALEASTHGAASDKAHARLDEIAAGVPLRVRFGEAAHLEPARREAAPALGPILATVYDAMSDEALGRLKVCRNEGCRWAFYDTSRNHSGVWCSMAICGNRQKGRVYRSRHATDQ
ncbi:MAG: CGNR zinc finger domain-containing protein [Candidatus Limnocylindria bacterium]